MNDPSTLVSRAFELHQQGQFDAARLLYQQALSANDRDRDALHLLGVLELQADSPNKAVEYLQRACDGEVDDPQLLANLGNACSAAGQWNEALAAFRQSLELNAHAPESWASLGNAHFTLGNFEDAIECYQRALTLNPALAEVWRGLSSTLLAMEQPTQALAAIERAQTALTQSGHTVTPPFVLTRGNVLMALGRTGEALTCFEQVVRAAPGFAQGYVSLGSAHRDLGQVDIALQNYRRAIEMAPDTTEAHFALALLQKDQGHLDDARASLDKVLAVDAEHGKAHRVVASLNKYSIDDPHLKHMQELVLNKGLMKDNREHLNFALGKALEDCGRYEAAFTHISEANRLHRDGIRYSPEREEACVSDIVRVFDRTLLQSSERREPLRPEGLVPIFIIGMPRSGTSLIEQILASHPSVYGAGELEWIDLCAREAYRNSVGKDGENADQPDQLVRTSAAHAAEIGTAYRQRMNTLVSEVGQVDAGWFVDKLPANFLHAGLIRMAIPEALIIHSRRHPMATCWSIFKNYLGARGHGYSFNQGELGHYYRLYRRLMAHWDEVMPGVIHHVTYEELVANQEMVSRRLLADCGIEWDKACLNFHQTRRPVKTLSATQVRRPIYTDSLAQWKHYERQLGPLIEAIGQEMPA